jgi:hypothetical protein
MKRSFGILSAASFAALAACALPSNSVDDLDSPIASSEEALTGKAKVIVPANPAGCPWNQAGNLAPENMTATAREGTEVSFKVPSGSRLNSLTITAPKGSVRYDDVLAILYGTGSQRRVIFTSDRRLRTYLRGDGEGLNGEKCDGFDNNGDGEIDEGCETCAAGDTSKACSAAVRWDWTLVRGKAIDNQNTQSAWCAAGAGKCVFPPTEVPGDINLTFPDFAAIDADVYPDATAATERTLTVVVIGDDNPESDCAHTRLELDVKYDYTKTKICRYVASQDNKVVNKTGALAFATADRHDDYYTNYQKTGGGVIKPETFRYRGNFLGGPLNENPGDSMIFVHEQVASKQVKPDIHPFSVVIVNGRLGEYKNPDVDGKKISVGMKVSGLDKDAALVHLDGSNTRDTATPLKGGGGWAFDWRHLVQGVDGAAVAASAKDLTDCVNVSLDSFESEIAISPRLSLRSSDGSQTQLSTKSPVRICRRCE